MHTSLIAQHARRLANPLGPPTTPIFDIHMHSNSLAGTARYVKAARRYGIENACNMESDRLAAAYSESFGGFFEPCGWPRVDRLDERPEAWEHFRRVWIDGFAELCGRGMCCVKLKTTPTPAGPDQPARPGRPRLDDERLADLYACCVRHRIALQVHVAQPSCWWPKPLDPRIVGTKTSCLMQTETLLRAFPKLIYIGAHMGSYPEDLEYLAHLMDSYPNYHVETSATKWVIRELSRQAEAAREFFIRYADRIAFGSDLCAGPAEPPSYYRSRLHEQRLMWETDFDAPSMIRDPDGPAEGVRLRGLQLPDEVLDKLYRQNARRLLAAADRPSAENTAAG